MHESTQAYLSLAAQDDALHASVTNALRAAMPPLTALTQHAAEKQHALFAARFDETDPNLRASFDEANDKIKSTARLVAEWHEKTVALSRLIQEVAAFNAKFSAAATNANEPVAEISTQNVTTA